MEIVDLILILIVSLVVRVALARYPQSATPAVNPPRTDTRRQNGDGPARGKNAKP
jgi:hypothetical protein